MGLAPNPYLRANMARSVSVALLLVFITLTLLFLLSSRFGVAHQSVNVRFDRDDLLHIPSCLLVFSMDTNRAEAQFADGSAIAIDCLAIEDEYGNTPAQRAELDWLLYNKPLECVQLVLSGEIEHYLSLGCDHGKLKD